MIQLLAVLKSIVNGAYDDSSCHLRHCLFVSFEVLVLLPFLKLPGRAFEFLNQIFMMV